MQEIKSVLESLLFVSSKPLKLKELVKFSESTEEQVLSSLKELKNNKLDSGVVVLESPEGWQLATNSQNSTQVKNFLNAELREKLTDATVEVLAIIAYRQPISKAEIEAIRGVNSQYSVRHLLMRGLIEKVQNPNDARSFLYQTTTELLQHLGIQSVADLPDFSELVAQIKLPETPALSPEEPKQPDVVVTNEIAQIIEAVDQIDPDHPGETTEVKIAEVDLNDLNTLEIAKNENSEEEDDFDDDEEEDDEEGENNI